MLRVKEQWVKGVVISAYVLVNNRAEGNAPLTVQALVGTLKR
jgi:hypothetical protein